MIVLFVKNVGKSFRRVEQRTQYVKKIERTKAVYIKTFLHRMCFTFFFPILHLLLLLLLLLLAMQEQTFDNIIWKYWRFMTLSVAF